jgi:hypothetical protein
LEFANVSQEGPQLDRLLHRLADCPADFLLPTQELDLTALACDHFRALGKEIPNPEQRRALSALSDEAKRLVLVVLWLVRDDWFLTQPELADATWRLLLSSELARLARLAPPDTAINDPDRREELVRLCLHELGLRPEGETAAQAADRLTTLDSVERERVIRETRKSETRAREIREAMARKRAEEAAARYSPE